MKKLYQAMLQLLNKGESFVQATVLTQSGSAPRTAGAKMIILADKSTMGTIGGGLVEARVQELAAEVFETKEAVTREYHLTGSEAGQMDMICGGMLEVLVEYMDASNKQLFNIYQDIVTAIEKRKRVVMVTPLVNRINEDSQSFLVKEDGSVTGTFFGPAEWMEQFKSQARSRYPKVITIDGQRFLVEPVSTSGTVYIFGAGHVSQRLALLTSLVDFRTIVLDDRKEFANRDRFPTADEVIVLENFEQAFKNLDIDKDNYLVIVTRGHAHDKNVLAQALRTKACYIGMIGSKRKRDTIYRTLREEGHKDDDLKKVYSPIGLEIAAETPEEIAVSIVAELIRVRAEQNK
ncbi:XdhC family aldehyde oxidoreductase maturation factor [Desulforamulus hydrothermalis]|uniref:XshC-Cox1-family protein n=1 Tax=Desulforamulus hydrothermalis Lam5 = DSM 18033 TaxID=1121428 RepID=K8E0R5_9FIRM|nr:XdhC/CoxI family protein [Desulforamulus hydrothermalis]CCO09207.1 XshC-Cox1-family protein [Desulforamulus hydrothermalis Lam5 = DSM 18033]SHH10659.1 xanthine dehydrogenase accessory factor [Desulforamulus hydrothermalis Lam5 = DSM 18033]